MRTIVMFALDFFDSFLPRQLILIARQFFLFGVCLVIGNGAMAQVPPSPSWGTECEQSGGVLECKAGSPGQVTWSIDGPLTSDPPPSCLQSPRSFEAAVQCVRDIYLINLSTSTCQADFVGIQSSPNTYTSSLGQYYQWSGLADFTIGLWAYTQTNNPVRYCYTSYSTAQLQAHWSRLITCEPGWQAANGYCSKPRIACEKCVGHPIEVGSGAKLLRETDIAAAAGSGLQLSRSYNSQGFIRPAGGEVSAREGGEYGVFGAYWRHNYQRELIAVNNGSVPVVYVVDSVGRHESFQKINGNWKPRSYSTETLEEILDSGLALAGWRYTKGNDSVEQFDLQGRLVSIRDRAGLTQSLMYSDGTAVAPGGAVATDSGAALPAGLLLSVTDSFGRAMLFAYRSDSRLTNVADPSGGLTQFGYDSINRLKTVTHPDGKVRQYIYYTEESLPALANSDGLLTGVADEIGVRWSTYSYDSSRRATTTALAGGVDKFTVTYSWSDVVSGAAGTELVSTIVDPLSTTKSSKMVIVDSIFRDGGDTQPCGTPNCTGTVTTSYTYDANGNIASRTDFNGNRTNYGYDLSRNLETSRTEGLTSAGATTVATRSLRYATGPHHHHDVAPDLPPARDHHRTHQCRQPRHHLQL